MSDPFGTPLPVVACTLGPVDLRDRRQDWETLLERGDARVSATPAGVRITFADADVGAELQRLAELESECCAFARWTVRTDGAATILDVQSEGEGVAAVKAMFGKGPDPT
jgi:hypothetical protein